MTRRGAGKWLGHPALGAACRLLVGGIFIYASLPKVLSPDEFARLVYGYRIMHPDFVNIVGITLPWVELAAGVFLVLGIMPQSSAAVLGGLLLMFISVGFLGIVRGLDIDCGCFFPFMSDHRLDWDLLVRDGLLLLATAQVVVWPSSFLPGKGGKSDD